MKVEQQQETLDERENMINNQIVLYAMWNDDGGGGSGKCGIDDLSALNDDKLIYMARVIIPRLWNGMRLST